VSTTPPADDAAKLKTARQRGRRTVEAEPVGATALSQSPEPEPTNDLDTVGMAMRRPTKVLFAPAERPAVVQSAGFVPDSMLSDYVRAETDASESFVPARARTPVSRLLWTKGALVRKDVYQAWLDRDGKE
jgi:hypothetical protein